MPISRENLSNATLYNIVTYNDKINETVKDSISLLTFLNKVVSIAKSLKRFATVRMLQRLSRHLTLLILDLQSVRSPSRFFASSPLRDNASSSS